MLIDVSSIRKNDGSSMPVSAVLDISERASGFSDVSVNGEIKNFAGVVSCKLSMSGKYRTVCDRCGAETEIPVEAEISSLIESDGTKDDSLLFTDGRIDLDRTVADALVLALPMQILCSEDCEGVEGEGFEVLTEE